jgi:hypothetical protein
MQNGTNPPRDYFLPPGTHFRVGSRPHQTGESRHTHGRSPSQFSCEDWPEPEFKPTHAYAHSAQSISACIKIPEIESSGIKLGIRRMKRIPSSSPSLADLRF